MYCRINCSTPYFVTIALSSSLISKDHFDTSYSYAVIISKVFFVELLYQIDRIMVKIKFFSLCKKSEIAVKLSIPFFFVSFELIKTVETKALAVTKAKTAEKRNMMISPIDYDSVD